MASPISGLTQLINGAIAPTDEVVIVDKSDPTMGAGGTDKRATYQDLFADEVTARNNAISAAIVGAPFIKNIAGGEMPREVATLATGTKNISLAADQVKFYTLGGNPTFTFPTTASNKYGEFLMFLTQDATGGRTVTWPSNTVLTAWQAGFAPSLDQRPNAVEVIMFYTQNGTTWVGNHLTPSVGRPITSISTNYTLQLSDTYSIILCTNSTPITITVPAAVNVNFAAGIPMKIVAMGTGSVTFATQAGVTIDVAGGTALSLSTRYLSADLTRVLSNEWLLEPRVIASSSGTAAPVLVQNPGSVHVNSTNHTVSLPANPTAGNLIAVALRSTDSGAGLVLPGGWNIVSGGMHFATSSFVSVGIAYKICTTPAVDKSFTYTTTASTIGDAAICEVANLAGTLDKTNFLDQSSNSTALSCQTGAITPTIANEFVLAICNTGGNLPKTCTDSSGATFNLIDASNLFNAEIAYSLISSTNTLNPTFGWASPGQRAIAMIASFQ